MHNLGSNHLEIGSDFEVILIKIILYMTKKSLPEENFEQYKIKVEELENEVSKLRRMNHSLVAEKREMESTIKLLLLQKEKKSKQELIGGSSKRFNMVTVLYSSVRGFSKLSSLEVGNAKDIIDELDKFYVQYDRIVDRNNIRKIKSIGDTYMCAGGIPRKNRTNPIEVIVAALQIQQHLAKMQYEAKKNGIKTWDLTIAIHSGPVIATESGKRKITYELKGETVNIAHRIESTVEPGKVIISEMTREFVRDYFECEYIGKMPAKYTGDIALYEVIGFRDQYRLNDNLYMPNKLFDTRLRLVRFDDLEEYILNRLEKELPKYLYYHNVKHTMDVIIGVEIIGTSEGVNEEEILILKTAALFHDMGQIVQSPGHEEISCKFAREILPCYGYETNIIEIICDTIMATKIPPKPQNLLQKIICDADLDYLGRSDFIPVSDTLYKELHEQNIIGDINEWNKLQIKFITNHSYFTEFARKNREVNKQMQIERIKKLIVE